MSSGADPGRAGVVGLHLRAHGRVQGVFYRDSTRDEAERLGVAGWVRNQPDQTVEAVLEGDADAVAALVSFCRSGPERARVDRLDVEPQEPEGLRGFEVR